MARNLEDADGMRLLGSAPPPALGGSRHGAHAGVGADDYDGADLGDLAAWSFSGAGDVELRAMHSAPAELHLDEHGEGGGFGDGGDGDEEPEEDMDAVMESERSYDAVMRAKPMLRTGQLIALNTIWAALQTYWFVLYIVTMPSQVLRIVGDDAKGYAMFVVFLVGGVVNFIASVVVGYLADRVYSPYGRRFTWLVAGVATMVPVTIGMAAAESLAAITLIYVGISLVSNAVSVPFNGLIADVVNSEQRGRASAVMGAMGLVGYVTGAGLGMAYTSIGDVGMYCLISGLLVVATGVTYAVIKEPAFTREDLRRIKQKEAIVRSNNLVGKSLGRNHFVYAMRWLYATIIYPLFEPLLVNRDFLWVFLTRFFMQLGQFTVQEFLQYWLNDCVPLPVMDGEPMPAETAVSVFMLPMLVAAALAALVSGYLSDRWGKRRRVFIYASGVLMVTVCVTLVFLRSLWIGLGVAVLFGAGYGTYQAVDFAIVMDVLPSRHDVARDVALWHLSLVLPQIFATPLAGLLLDAFETVGDNAGIMCLGYTVIWTIAAVYFCLGSAFIGRVRGIR